MIIGKWIIPEEYKVNSNTRRFPGRWQGDCVYVLSWDKQNKMIHAWLGRAGLNKVIQEERTAIITSTSDYYEKIKKMVPVDEDYKTSLSEQKMKPIFITYLFRIVNWEKALR